MPIFILSDGDGDSEAFGKSVMVTVAWRGSGGRRGVGWRRRVFGALPSPPLPRSASFSLSLIHDDFYD